MEDWAAKSPYQKSTMIRLSRIKAASMTIATISPSARGVETISANKKQPTDIPKRKRFQLRSFCGESSLALVEHLDQSSAFSGSDSDGGKRRQKKPWCKLRKVLLLKELFASAAENHEYKLFNNEGPYQDFLRLEDCF